MTSIVRDQLGVADQRVVERAVHDQPPGERRILTDCRLHRLARGRVDGVEVDGHVTAAERRGEGVEVGGGLGLLGGRSSALAIATRQAGPRVVQRRGVLELEHARGLGAVGAAGLAELADHAVVGDAELDAELLEAHHDRRAVGLEDAGVGEVVDDRLAGAQRFELAEHTAQRRHRRVVGDRALRLGEVRHGGDR